MEWIRMQSGDLIYKDRDFHVHFNSIQTFKTPLLFDVFRLIKDPINPVMLSIILGVVAG